MNHRRKLVIALGVSALAASFAVRAQPAGKIFQIGYLGNATPSQESALVDAFRQGLREHGYIEGKNIFIHFRWAEGRNEAFPALVVELLALNVEVLVASTTPAASAAKKSTTATPIVLAGAGDAVGTGLVASLAQPGGNITGISTLYTQTEGKRIEILHELIPRMKRIALLMSPANPLTPLILKSTRAAADALRISAQTYNVRAADEFERVFAAIAKTRPDAMAVQGDRALMLSNRVHIVQFAAKNGLPTIYVNPEFVEEGGLVSYGAYYKETYQRAAIYVDKILKGAKPANLPVEQPTKFDFVVNMKTAKALGIKIPNSILVQATKVIE
jgi:putative ABC transport system substrate-binding protein